MDMPPQVPIKLFVASTTRSKLHFQWSGCLDFDSILNEEFKYARACNQQQDYVGLLNLKFTKIFQEPVISNIK